MIAGGAARATGEGDGHGRFGIWDLEVREYVILVPILAAILFIGLYPKPLLERIEPATRRTVACVTQARPGYFAYVPLTGTQPVGGQSGC